MIISCNNNPQHRARRCTYSCRFGNGHHNGHHLSVFSYLHSLETSTDVCDEVLVEYGHGTALSACTRVIVRSYSVSMSVVSARVGSSLIQCLYIKLSMKIIKTCTAMASDIQTLAAIEPSSVVLRALVPFISHVYS